MMEVKEYCDNMRAELSNWKNEIRDILNAVEVFPESDKKLLSSQIATLRDLVSDISGRIDRVR